MKPWREVAVPHRDVLEGTFQQSEFAADITAVQAKRATVEYQDAAAFFDRTFITEGMSVLLTQVAQRWSGAGGEPVIQLQTAFGGGKTHTMLAVYHLATRAGDARDLAGVAALLDKAGIADVPRARVAVLDGNAHAPGQPWKHGPRPIRTLWGELAYQLGGEDGYALVAESDLAGTSPGKTTLAQLLETYAPCVVLIDELVAYVRQFEDDKKYAGGSYDSNLSFAHALTEAAKLVPRALVLASLPESEVEAGSARGVATLKALEKTFGRVQALWKPVATEEAFEIVRRRLFEPIRDVDAQRATCRAFAQLYATEGGKVPSETHEGRYHERLLNAYPIHPEFFDRLYEDWTTLDAFQRTRGVLKLMARVIYRLWVDQNSDAMILPGSLPLYDSGARNELTYYLPAGWDAVIDRDVDGDRAETAEIDTKEGRFGAVSAARRVARTVFLGSAPSSGAPNKSAGARGIDRARTLLGCLQPGQSSALYSDALARLADRLHYLNSSGDKSDDSTRFWFDTRANLRREMEDRKSRLDAWGADVRERIAKAIGRLGVGGTTFEGVHVFTAHADVPDDAALRLVVLDPEHAYGKQEPEVAKAAVVEHVRNHGSMPRHRGNRLVFVAPDRAALGRLTDVVRTALAWASIVEDIEKHRLNIDRLQEEQAKKELDAADKVVPRATRDCFRWLLCPVMNEPTDREITVEAFPIEQKANAYGSDVERVALDNELVIGTWSPIHLRDKLRTYYWKGDAVAVRAMAVWEDTQKYLYLPRLKAAGVLEQAIDKGAASKDFFGIAYGQQGDRFEGFQLGGARVQLDGTLLLVEPGAAAAYAATQSKPEPLIPPPPIGGTTTTPPTGMTAPLGGGTAPAKPPALAKSFIGAIDVKASTAKMKLVTIAEEVIAVLAADPNATVRVTVEIAAEFPNGADETTRRAVSENTTQLGFKSRSWE